MELLICSPSARVGSTKPVGGDAVQLQLGALQPPVLLSQNFSAGEIGPGCAGSEATEVLHLVESGT